MKFESEIVANKILPAVRKSIAEKLSQDYGWTQEEIARAMNLTQPAVSQYLKGKRSNPETVEKLENDPQTQIMLEDAVKKIAQDQNYTQELQDMVKTIRDKGIMKKEFKDSKRIL